MRKRRTPKLLLGLLIIVSGALVLVWYFILNSSVSLIPPVTPLPSANIVKTLIAEKFGISVGTNLFSLNQKELNYQLDDMVSLGIGWLRFDIDWSSVQPNNPENFNWTNIDKLVAAVNAHKIKLLPILTYTPSWAHLNSCYSSKCLPADNSAFAVFAAAAVRRYSSQGIHTWEIWNEPNLKSFWKPSPDATAYANLLKITYDAIKTEDPSAFIITGGVGPTDTGGGDIAPVDFITQLYKGGAKNYFDAIGFHPYSFPARPSDTKSSNAWSQMSVSSQNLRSVMTENGDSKKTIWMTEFGAPTGGPYNQNHVTEERQSLIINDAINLARTYLWAGPLFFYSYKDLGISTNTNENFFGIIRFDGSQKPAYQMIKQLLTQE